MKQTKTPPGGSKLWGLAAYALLLGAGSATAQTVDDVWLGGAGSWTTATRWSHGVPNNNVPVGATYNVLIDNGNAALSSVALNSNVSINNLSIDSGDRMSVGNGSSLAIMGSSIANAGTLSMNAMTDNADLVINAPSVTLSGAGKLTLSNNANNRIYGSTATDVLTNQGTIQGAGQIGVGQLTLVNSGTINANQTNDLEINTGASFTNTGLVESTAAGGLLLDAVTVTNTGGTLSSSGSGAVYLENGTTINGGTLKGKFYVTNTATFGGPLNNSAGVVSIEDGAALTLANGNYSQLGKVLLNSTADSTRLIIAGAHVTLGSGTVTLSNSPNNIISGTSASNILSNQGVIQGAGQIGAGELTLVNSGTINANRANALLINTSASFTNTGLVESTAVGGLVLVATTVTNTGGTLSSSGSGAVYLENGSTINGGTLQGTVFVTNSATFGGPLNNSAGVVSILDSAALTLGNGNYAQFGQVQLNSSGDATRLIIAGTNVTLGDGTVTLSNNPNNLISGTSVSNSLTNQGLIQGAGQIGGGQLKLVNSGTINANQADNALVINTGASFTNTGLVESTAAGGLILDATTVTNTGGTISGTGGGAVYLESGTTITGGTLKGKSYVTNTATFGGPLNNSAGVVSVDDTAALTLENGDYSQFGRVQLNSAGDSTRLIIAGTHVTLGGGTLTLSNNSNNLISGTSASNILSNQGIIQGAGQLGDGALTLVNSGTIKANQTDNALVINTGGSSFTNTGLVESTAAGGLVLDATTVTNTGGTISSSASGAVYLEDGTTINGGTIKGTVFVTAATFSGPLNNSGVVKVIDQATLTLQNGNYTHFGTVQLDSTSDNTDLILAGTNVTLGGSTITLSNSSFNRIYGVSASDTLTNQGIIQGAGQIGIGQLTLVNSGTINANQSDGMTINASPSFTNNGTLAVSAGDLMHVTGGTFSNFKNGILRGGTYNIAGTLQIDQLGSTGGEIVNNAATLVLNGTASSVVDSGGLDALAKLATNSATGSFSLTGSRNFNTAGRFSNAGSLTIGAGSTLTVGGPAVFTQTAGTTTDDGNLSATGGIHLSGGSLFGTGDVNGNLQSSGVITPGKAASGTGILTTSGSYTQAAAGSLDISIGGKTAGANYDELNASTAVLGGNLNISLINGFVPTVGSTFKIVNFNAGSGQFANVSGLAINGSEHFTLSYQSTDVILNVVSGASTGPVPSFTRFPKTTEMGARSVARMGVSRFNLAEPIASETRPFNFALSARAKNEALLSGGTSQSARIASFQRLPLETRSILGNQAMASPLGRVARTSFGVGFSGAMSGLHTASVSVIPVASKAAANIPLHSLGVHAKSTPKMNSGSFMISTSGLFSKPHVFYTVN